MTGICERTLHNMIDHLACSLSDREGSELRRIAEKNGTYDPDANGLPDGVDFAFDENEERLNHIRWSERFLTSVINDAFRILHIERPDLFAGSLTLELEPGCLTQQLPCECVDFLGMVENSNCAEDGHVPSQVSGSQASVASNLAKYFCNSSSSDENYKVKSFAYNPKIPGQITLIGDPPPFGEKTIITVYCSLSPPCYDWPADENEILGGECDPKLDLYEPYIIEWALHRAFESDKESLTSKDRAESHYNHAFHLIKEGKTSDYFLQHPDLYLIGPIDKGTGDGVLLRE